MPIVSGKTEPSHRPRRRLLAVAGLLLGPPLLLPLVPFVTPVTLQVGDRLLIVRGDSAADPQDLCRRAGPATAS